MERAYLVTMIFKTQTCRRGTSFGHMYRMWGTGVDASTYQPMLESVLIIYCFTLCKSFFTKLISSVSLSITTTSERFRVATLSHPPTNLIGSTLHLPYPYHRRTHFWQIVCNTICVERYPSTGAKLVKNILPEYFTGCSIGLCVWYQRCIWIVTFHLLEAYIS